MGSTFKARAASLSCCARYRSLVCRDAAAEGRDGDFATLDALDLRLGLLEGRGPLLGLRLGTSRPDPMLAFRFAVRSG